MAQGQWEVGYNLLETAEERKLPTGALAIPYVHAPKGREETEWQDWNDSVIKKRSSWTKTRPPFQHKHFFLDMGEELMKQMAEKCNLNFTEDPKHNQGKKQKCYTPAYITDAARTVVCFDEKTGKVTDFDLDPFSDPEANKNVRAKNIIALPHNGFICSWIGYRKLWVNPPFSGKLNKFTAYKMCMYHRLGLIEEACLLLPADASTEYDKLLQKHSQAFCRMGRVKFNGPNRHKSPYRQCITVWYFGDRWERFRDVFSEQGKLAAWNPAEKKHGLGDVHQTNQRY